MKLKLFVMQLISGSLLLFAVTDEGVFRNRVLPNEGEKSPYSAPEVSEKHPSSTILKETTKRKTTDQEGYAGAGSKVPDRNPSTGQFRAEERPDKDIPVKPAE